MVLKACDYSDPGQVSDGSASPWKVSFPEGHLPEVTPEEGGVDMKILI